MAVTLSVGVRLAEDDDEDDDDGCFKTTPSASSSNPGTISLIGASTSPRAAVASNPPVIGRIGGIPTRSVLSPSSGGSDGAAFSAQVLPAGQAAGIGDNLEARHRPQCVARRRKKKFG